MPVSDNAITQLELAKRLDVTTVTIRNWENKTQEDFIGPFPEATGTGKLKKYNWNVCLTWYVKMRAYTQYRELFQRNEEEDWGEVKKKEDALKARIDRQTKEIELAEAQGAVAPIADLEAKWLEAVLSMRQKLMAVTPRLSVALQLGAAQKEIVDTEINRLLLDLAKND